MKKDEKFQPKRRRLRKRLCFAVDDDLIARIDIAARAARVGRSFVIREVVRGWLDERRIGA
jgi:hypothetical protein